MIQSTKVSLSKDFFIFNISEIEAIFMNLVGPSHYMSSSKDAPDGHAPFQCSLQKNQKHFCGCAIISPEWIITTAECLCGLAVIFFLKFQSYNNL